MTIIVAEGDGTANTILSSARFHQSDKEVAKINIKNIDIPTESLFHLYIQSRICVQMRKHGAFKRLCLNLYSLELRIGEGCSNLYQYFVVIDMPDCIILI